jgi:PAS domain S-box-containing protein
MDPERDLLFGLIALQGGLIDADDLAEAWGLLRDRGGKSLADVLIARGRLRAEDLGPLDYLLGRALQSHGGDSAAASEATLERMHPSSSTLDIVEEARTSRSLLQTLPERDAPDRTLADAGSMATIDLESSAAGSMATIDFEAALTGDETVQATIEFGRGPSRAARPAPRNGDAAPALGGRYSRLVLHASGGIGRVWRVRDDQIGREVALKALREENADDFMHRARFLREAKITGQLEHPGIVPVYELGRHAEDGQPFYTMRLIKGRTLAEASRAFHAGREAGGDDPLALVTLLNAFVAASNAVAYAHSRGIIHRDLKGDNVILGDFGEVIVLDWGLAKRIGFAERESGPGPDDFDPDEQADPARTIQGRVVGTPAYMAPEQAAGDLDALGRHTDIYGLGAILYEILAGRPPFGGASTGEVLRRVRRGEVEPPRKYWPGAHPALEATCLRALARDPADRWGSAAELAREIQGWQESQRREAEEALRRQTSILQSILNSMSEGVLVADGEGRPLLTNPAAGRMLPEGDSPFPAEDSPLLRAVGGEEIDDAEMNLPIPGHPEGIWVGASARPLRDEAGATSGGLVVLRDITERKHAEEALRRSRERFELAVRGSQDGLWDWDLENGDVYFSPRWKGIIGYEDHELPNRLNEWDERLHPDEREMVLAANHAHIDGATPHYEQEYRLRHKDGSYRWILARGVALRDADGRAYRMAGSHVDVTEWKRAEGALGRCRSRHRALMEIARGGIAILGPDGRVRESNPGAARLLGLPPGDLDGLSWPGLCRDAIREDGSPLPADSDPAALAPREGQAGAEVALGLPRPDGGTAWISASARCLVDPDGGPPEVVLSFEAIEPRPPSA